MNLRFIKIFIILQEFKVYYKTKKIIIFYRITTFQQNKTKHRYSKGLVYVIHVYY